MPSTKFSHPESGQESISTNKIDKPAIEALVKRIKNATDSRETWEMKKLSDYQRRFGIRKAKAFPWPGCSNLNIPLTDAKIREAKPNFVNAVFGITPMLSLEPVGKSDPENARRSELFYDWLVRYRMKNSWLEEMHNIDNVLTYGQGYQKVSWNYKTARQTMAYDLTDLPEIFERNQTEQELRNVAFLEFGLTSDDPEDADAIDSFIRQYKAGKQIIHVTNRVVVNNEPVWTAIDPRDIVVPWDAGDDIDSLPWISQRLYMTPEEIEEKVYTYYFDKFAAKAVLDRYKDKIGGRKTSDVYRDIREEIETSREGVNRSVEERHYVDIHEVYFWHDVNDDGVKERVVACIDQETSEVLRIKEYPYAHGQLPFTRFVFEVTDRRWYSPRGIPEILHDLQGEMNTTHNAWIDRMTLQNAMSYKYREGSIRNPSSVQVMPGSGIPVKRMDDLEVLNIPMLDFSFDNQEKVLRAWADDYIGSSNLAFTNVVQRSERRTATEVDQMGQGSRIIQSLDVSLYQESKKRVHWQTFKLWTQYGDERVWMRVDKKQPPIEIKKSELLGDYDFVPSGSLDNSTAQQRQQRAMSDMAVGRDEIYGRFVNQYELVRDYFESSPNFRSSERYLRPPGMFEQDAGQEQAAEIVWMQALGIVADVEQTDVHQVHVQVLQAALQNVKDEDLRNLYVAHLALHMMFLGQKAESEQLLQQIGFQAVETGPGRLSAAKAQQ